MLILDYCRHLHQLFLKARFRVRHFLTIICLCNCCSQLTQYFSLYTASLISTLKTYFWWGTISMALQEGRILFIPYIWTWVLQILLVTLYRALSLGVSKWGDVYGHGLMDRELQRNPLVGCTLFLYMFCSQGLGLHW